jgi:cytochrome c556/protein tyrosine phosphatase (PTP) superfamily phosphohydrolase (DUF442 family)
MRCGCIAIVVMPIWVIAFCTLIVAAVTLSCRQSVPPAAAPVAAGQPAFDPIRNDALPNAHRVTQKVICGGLPDGEEGFRALERLGVKTVISVDGITPQVELAHAHGMRYVHLPFGYDGVPVSQGEAIAKAISDMPGPVYVHCHHGQHRAPAAVAVACVTNGTLAPGQAGAVLKTFGTGANYRGLWQSAEAARPLDPKVLKDLKVSFVEKSPIPAMAEAMVRVDDEFDALKAMRKSNWKTIQGDAAHTALQLEELLVEVKRSDAGAAKPEEFHHFLDESVSNIRHLKALLEAQPIDLPAAEEALKQVTGSCTACHKNYRDVRSKTGA